MICFTVKQAISLGFLSRLPNVKSTATMVSPTPCGRCLHYPRSWTQLPRLLHSERRLGRARGSDGFGGFSKPLPFLQPILLTSDVFRACMPRPAVRGPAGIFYVVFFSVDACHLFRLKSSGLCRCATRVRTAVAAGASQLAENYGFGRQPHAVLAPRPVAAQRRRTRAALFHILPRRIWPALLLIRLRPTTMRSSRPALPRRVLLRPELAPHRRPTW